MPYGKRKTAKRGGSYSKRAGRRSNSVSKRRAVGRSGGTMRLEIVHTMAPQFAAGQGATVAAAPVVERKPRKAKA